MIINIAIFSTYSERRCRPVCVSFSFDGVAVSNRLHFMKDPRLGGAVTDKCLDVSLCAALSLNISFSLFSDVTLDL